MLWFIWCLQILIYCSTKDTSAVRGTFVNRVNSVTTLWWTLTKIEQARNCGTAMILLIGHFKINRIHSEWGCYGYIKCNTYMWDIVTTLTQNRCSEPVTMQHWVNIEVENNASLVVRTWGGCKWNTFIKYFKSGARSHMFYHVESQKS